MSSLSVSDEDNACVLGKSYFSLIALLIQKVQELLTSPQAVSQMLDDAWGANLLRGSLGRLFSIQAC